MTVVTIGVLGAWAARRDATETPQTSDVLSVHDEHSLGSDLAQGPVGTEPIATIEDQQSDSVQGSGRPSSVGGALPANSEAVAGIYRQSHESPHLSPEASILPTPTTVPTPNPLDEWRKQIEREQQERDAFCAEIIATKVQPLKNELSLVQSKIITVRDDVIRETRGYGVSAPALEARIEQRRNELKDQEWDLKIKLADLRVEYPQCVF